MAESDLAAQQKRAKIEEDKMAKDKLIEDHSTVRETIKDEISELEMIKQQCSKDLQSIGEQCQYHARVIFWHNYLDIIISVYSGSMHV